MMQNVLELMLLSYAFMVSGLFVPLLGALFWKKGTSEAAFWAMLLGGGTTTFLVLSNIKLPWGLDANIGGILLSAIVFISLSYIFPKEKLVKIL
jgi:SSS family solute:Na+ symporter